jgi:hypothetical protein
MIQGVACLCDFLPPGSTKKFRLALQIYFLPPSRPKTRLGEVEKVKLQGVVRPCEIFSAFWRSKMRHREVKKTMLQSVAWNCELIFCLLNCPTWILARSRKHCFKGSPVYANTFSATWAGQNATLFFENRCFKVTPGTKKSISSSWLSQNSTWLKSRIRTHFLKPGPPNRRLGWFRKSYFLKGSHRSKHSFSASGPAQNAIWARTRERCING